MSNYLQPLDCSLPGSSVYGILQARILEWVAISCFTGASKPRDWTCISCISYIGHLESPSLALTSFKSNMFLSKFLSLWSFLPLSPVTLSQEHRSLNLFYQKWYLTDSFLEVTTCEGILGLKKLGSQSTKTGIKASRGLRAGFVRSLNIFFLLW